MSNRIKDIIDKSTEESFCEKRTGQAFVFLSSLLQAYIITGHVDRAGLVNQVINLIESDLMNKGKEGKKM